MLKNTKKRKLEYNIKKKRYLSDEDVTQICELYKKGCSCQDIFRKTGFPEESIRHHLKKNGLYKTGRYVLTEDEQNEIRRLYNDEKVTITELSKTYHKTTNKIKDVLNYTYKEKCMINLTPEERKDIAIKYKNGSTTEELYEEYKDKVPNIKSIGKIAVENGGQKRKSGPSVLRHDYFENIDTANKAYFLGFMIADGCVRQPKYGQAVIQINLNLEDKYILEKFAEEIETKNKIIIINSKPNKQGQVKVSSDKMFSDLCKLCVVPNKTYNLSELPKIPDKYMPDMIRGFFDGDGSVSVYHEPDKNGSSCVVKFTGRKEFLEKLQDYLVDKISIKRTKIFSDDSVSYLKFASHKDVLSYYKFIYYAEDVACLSRKRIRFENFFDEKKINYKDTILDKAS